MIACLVYLAMNCCREERTTVSLTLVSDTLILLSEAFRHEYGVRALVPDTRQQPQSNAKVQIHAQT